MLKAKHRLEDDIRTGLELVSQFLHARIAALRAAGVPVGEDDYRGLYISERDVDRLLSEGATESRIPSRDNHLEGLRDELERLTSTAAGRLGRLISSGPFSAEETGAILLCLATECDTNTERLLAYAQDDVSRRRPRVGLLVDLFSREPFAGRDAWQPTAPLRRTRVVQLLDEGGGNVPLTSRTATLDPRIAEYLLGGDSFAEPLATRAQVVTPGEDGGAFLPDVTLQRMGRIAGFQREGKATVIGLCGADEGLVRIAAEFAAKQAGVELTVVALPELEADTGLDVAIALSVREAELRGTALFLEGASRLSAGVASKLEDALNAERTTAQLLLVGLDETANWPGIRLQIPDLDFDKRRQLWERSVGGGNDSESRRAILDSVAGRFRLGEEAIRRAGAVATMATEWRDGDGELTLDDLFAAARGQSTPILSGLAQKVASRFEWDDLVLPADGIEQLREIAARVEYQHRVLETWGFEKKLDLGRGAIALFAGNSGTGKTMAAGVMANSLSLDLYRVDLSSIVSKYIGETEKNLDAIFREAERSNAILFFDEADALFGKRSEVKDAHDRYANIETAYLLQRMEAYSGVVILATNLKMNLDEAFLRRLHFAVDFPMPNEAHRKLIWQKAFPAEAPLADDIDWAFLGRQFKISGGNIKNSVIAAAFFAAAEDERIGMSHLVRAIRREYQKLGRMVTAAEFGSYASLVSSAE